MIINNRLLACIDLIQGDFLCDVGTDHGLLPVYAIQKQIVRQAIACDIGKQPLDSARSTVEKYHLCDQIQLVLSDGLQKISGEKLTDIVVAGMGGETILHILETCPFSTEQKHFILQPMTKAELLRAWLYANGYKIQKEICVPDGKFLYAVLSVVYSGIRKNPSAGEIYFGKMDLHTQNGYAYAERQYQRLCKTRDGRLSAGQDVAELDKTILILKGLLSCR